MYESFYGFREKPFSLLPDAGFLYLSGQHRMALTLLEYGLMNQAGFTVISGDIGTGKTTLIRQLLNQIDSDIKVGLITNTHRSFGELMQWIALAFELPHQGKDRVSLYRDFMTFVIEEYAQGRRTVLIVDEAQNMSSETLEELRMLSNVNADKDQVLQVVLVGQRELRETLRRPDLIQFAQRIGVDYHLEPLSEEETRNYIRHRCQTAGGAPDLFSDQACVEIYSITGGVPRMINMLCDTSLVYGYAEQRERIDATLVRDVARDRQQTGLFPGKQDTSAVSRQTAPESGSTAATTQSSFGGPSSATSKPASSQSLRVAIASESELLRLYLSRLLGKCDLDVVATVPLTAEAVGDLEPDEIDVLLVELDDRLDSLDQALYEELIGWKQPILFNDSLSTEASLTQANRDEYGRKLRQKLIALVPHTPQSVA
jgi:general secretion pathway protein A